MGEVAELRVYPNPTIRQFCIVVTPVITGERILLYSPIGELVRTYNASQSRLYVADELPSGVYIIKYGQRTTKLVIIK